MKKSNYFIVGLIMLLGAQEQLLPTNPPTHNASADTAKLTPAEKLAEKKKDVSVGERKTKKVSVRLV